MNDEQWLREGLADAVPEPPITPDRARSAERLARRRRRQAAAGAGGVVGVIAGAAALTAALTGGGVSDHVASDPPGALQCPPIKLLGVAEAEGSAIDQPDPDAPDAVPAGATSARLCQGPGTQFHVPVDALTTGIEGLVAAVNALEPVGPPDACTAELGPGYRIVFGYPDGSTFVVSGLLYGCQTLTVGSGYRADPEAAKDAFTTRLLAQRQASDPPAGGVASAPGCAGTAAIFDPAPGDPLVAAALCVRDTGKSGDVMRVPIPAADLATLVADIAANAHPVNGIPRCYREEPYLAAQTAWGDPVTIDYQCNAYYLPDRRAWEPSAAAQSIIDRLAGRAG
jgi:hypothetical protein